ncbi:hypothetical protein ABIA94_002260 [Bradyrhizobium sp. LA7.1]
MQLRDDRKRSRLHNRIKVVGTIEDGGPVVGDPVLPTSTTFLPKLR